ncbi:thioredoxin domain-containing protein [uncultured Dokdonia sp.]|uniref:thioredoxin domain-containing protein n=1 Tax=uncultured Dokdonia sp. TaxID=575653 RepID=UPI002609A2DE|nr:thioredoxin domain-containing protein [uncultured Dokdonia sp.]
MKLHIPVLAFITAILITSCKGKTDTTMQHDYTNDLIKETSPYLLQHAHNPVDWKAWNDETLAQAKKENKLILVSIGYSSCHWCHVMEHESFEDTLVAQFMNENFINIKVDREERPDVDNVYMNAVQLMTGRGGWPLNAIALPDGRPVWGGTYFSKEDWLNALGQVADIYTSDPNKLVEYADKLGTGLAQMDLVTPNPNKPSFVIDTLQTSIEKWSRQWDTRQGGLNRAPKFMMPNNYEFLLRYAHQNNDEEILEYVNTTLEQIAFGGVNDQVGGGFARYSVDTKWHIPHFEKMLYDNAQLVSLYSNAYLKTKNPLYKETVYETLEFIKREMTTAQGGFYSALDADSLTPDGELEEGAYYVWTEEELKNLVGDDFELFSAYYNINDYGKWENDHYVLIRQDLDTDFIKEHQISLEELTTKKSKWREDLLRFRESKKEKPRLDDKILTSWNGLMTKGYVDAYRVFDEKEFLDAALKNANFVVDNLLRKDGGLNRTYKDGKSTINAYLEDYAATIDAFIALFEVTMDEQWLAKAKSLTDYTFTHFQNAENKLFFFTSNEDPTLSSRNTEFYDNVIPSSNSIMAKNIFTLSHYYLDKTYTDTAAAMLNNMQPNFTQSPTSFSNWMDLMLNYTKPYYELVVVGPDAQNILAELEQEYLPNKLIAATTTASKQEIFEGRYLEGETLIYVCVNNACKLPVKTVKETLNLIEL